MMYQKIFPFVCLLSFITGLLMVTTNSRDSLLDSFFFHQKNAIYNAIIHKYFMNFKIIIYITVASLFFQTRLRAFHCKRNETIVLYYKETYIRLHSNNLFCEIEKIWNFKTFQTEVISLFRKDWKILEKK